MKTIGNSQAALLGLALIGAVLLVLSQTGLVTDGGMISAAGFAVLIISAFRLVDLADRGNRDKKD